MPGVANMYTNALDLMNSLGLTVRREVSIKETYFKDIDHDIDVHYVVYEK